MTNPHHPNPWANLHAALQYLLDCQEDSGWQLNHYAVVMGLQRMDTAGVIHNTAWVVSPTEQAEYITDGLLSCAEEMRASAEADDD